MGMAEDGVATFVWSSWQSPYDGTSVHARRRDAAGGLGAVTPVALADGTSFDAPEPEARGHAGRRRDRPLDAFGRIPATAVPDDVLTRTWNADDSWEQPDVAGTGLTDGGGRRRGRSGRHASRCRGSATKGQRSDVRGYVRLRRPDGTWADAVTLAGPDAQRTLDPFVAVEGDGDALAIWRSQSFDDSTFTQTDFVETMATGTPPPDDAGAADGRSTYRSGRHAPAERCDPPFVPQSTAGVPRDPAADRPPRWPSGTSPPRSPTRSRPRRRVVKASTLLKGKLDLAVKPTDPERRRPRGVHAQTGRADQRQRPRPDQRQRPRASISDNGLGLIGTAAGNIIGTACCNLIGTAAGNIIGQNHRQPARNARARSAASVRLTVLAKGTEHFATPKAGKLRLKVGRKGRAAIRRALRRPGRQTIKVLYLVGFTERGSTSPTVFTARQIKLRE